MRHQAALRFTYALAAAISFVVLLFLFSRTPDILFRPRVPIWPRELVPSSITLEGNFATAYSFGLMIIYAGVSVLTILIFSLAVGRDMRMSTWPLKLVSWLFYSGMAIVFATFIADYVL